jgi:transposase
MGLYGGIDLHSNNLVLALVDRGGQMVSRQRLPNELDVVLEHLAPHRERVLGLVVESTYNWYWLVDGLMEAGYPMHLANPAAMQQYSGLKHTDDQTDARWLAEMLRLGVLPEGYIYPKAERPWRDLLRKRAQLVRQRTANLLSVQNLIHRNTGVRLTGRQVWKLTGEGIREWVKEPRLAQAVEANRVVLNALQEQIQAVEQAIREGLRPRPELRLLRTVPGIGEVLGWTILLETGAVERFASVGQYASYCRCVSSQKLSNGKRKGRGNGRNGNRYLAWAFVEAAHFAVRYQPSVRRFYQRKRSRRNAVVGFKAVAHKLARATYFVLRDGVAFQLGRAF